MNLLLCLSLQYRRQRASHINQCCAVVVVVAAVAVVAVVLSLWVLCWKFEEVLEAVAACPIPAAVELPPVGVPPAFIVVALVAAVGLPTVVVPLLEIVVALEMPYALSFQLF
jgi:hypothetical protein